jgi:hypothetical protein
VATQKQFQNTKDKKNDKTILIATHQHKNMRREKTLACNQKKKKKKIQTAKTKQKKEKKNMPMVQHLTRRQLHQ